MSANSKRAMKHGTNCKFCQNPITVEIDDAYANLGDPFKLIKIACCDRCADLRVERRMLEDKVRKVCRVRELDPKLAKTREQSHRSTLEKLLKQYSNMIARWHYLSGMCWDDRATETIMDHPEAWNSVLATLWKIFKDANPARSRI